MRALPGRTRGSDGMRSSSVWRQTTASPSDPSLGLGRCGEPSNDGADAHRGEPGREQGEAPGKETEENEGSDRFAALHEAGGVEERFGPRRAAVTLAAFSRHHRPAEEGTRGADERGEQEGSPYSVVRPGEREAERHRGVEQHI